MLTDKVLIAIVAWLILIPMLPGCVHQQYVTTRPEYAFPQNLISLCGGPAVLDVSNKGIFSSTYVNDRSNELLLSPHFLPISLAENRRIVFDKVSVSEDRSIRIDVVYDDGRTFFDIIPVSRTRCNEQGEFIVHYPSDSYYLWASIGNTTREMALWTNTQGDLIAQNRWKETHRGLVGGEILGDAWAIFKHQDFAQAENTVIRNLDDAGGQEHSLTHCQSLSGDFDPKGEVIAPDGRLDNRPATEQFFREDIIGVHPVNQEKKPATTLKLLQEENNTVVMSLYGQEGLMATRTLDEKDISCEKGKWAYKGETKAHSAWTLLAASGGVYWEDLILWRDDNGDLLVNGTFKSRGVVLLVPMGHTERIFVAYRQR